MSSQLAIAGSMLSTMKRELGHFNAHSGNLISRHRESEVRVTCGQ